MDMIARTGWTLRSEYSRVDKARKKNHRRFEEIDYIEALMTETRTGRDLSNNYKRGQRGLERWLEGEIGKIADAVALLETGQVGRDHFWVIESDGDGWIMTGAARSAGMTMASAGGKDGGGMQGRPRL